MPMFVLALIIAARLQGRPGAICRCIKKVYCACRVLFNHKEEQNHLISGKIAKMEVIVLDQMRQA